MSSEAESNRTKGKLCQFQFVTENVDAMQKIYNVLDLQRLKDKSSAGVLEKVCMMPSQAMDGAFNKARKMVSGNRRRFVNSDYDLDLTYITTRIIAMAFPGIDSVGEFSTAVRNDMRVVKRFLQERHAGRCKVYNLCAEKTYSAQEFAGHVEWIPVLDHQPPTLRQIKVSVPSCLCVWVSVQVRVSFMPEGGNPGVMPSIF